MTIQINDRRKEYAGNGVATTFDGPRAFASSDLAVFLVDDATNAASPVSAGDYMVVGIGKQNTTLTLNDAPPAGKTLLILRTVDYDQPTSIRNQSAYLPETHEGALDRIVMQVQQIADRQDRSIRFADTILDADAEVKNLTPLGPLVVRADGRGFEVGNPLGTGDMLLRGELAGEEGAALVGYGKSHLSASLPITAAYAGAVGGGVVDDTPAFAALEGAHHGASVDLLGKTYAVNATPQNARYYNGAFKSGGAVIAMPRHRKNHPLEGDAVVVSDSVDAHLWPGPAGHFVVSDVMVVTSIECYRHEVSIGAPLIAEISYDNGATLERPVTVYSNGLYQPVAPVGGMFSSTRFGMVYALLDAGGYVQGTQCSYTDAPESGVWTHVTIPTTSVFPYGDPVFDDAGGINVFGYGGGPIHKLRSADGGATWALTSFAVPAGLPALVEATVVKIAPHKYLMVARNDAGGNAYACTSTDLVSWTPWVDSGIPLGLNPILAKSWGGRLFLYIMARNNAPVYGHEDKLLYLDVDGEAVYAAGGYVGPAAPYVAYAGKSSMVGYLTITDAGPGGECVGYLIDGETATGSSVAQIARLVRIGGQQVAFASPAIVKARRSTRPITDNSSFAHWSRGTSFTGTGMTADRWRTAGAIDTVSRVLTVDSERRILPHAPNYALRMQSASGSGRYLFQAIPGQEAMSQLADRVMTLTAYVSGTLPGYYRFIVSMNFGGGGSAIRETFADCSASVLAGGITKLTATVQSPSVDGATFGSSPALRLQFFSNGAGPVDARFLGLWVDFGDASVNLDPESYNAERSVLDRYCQRLEWDAGRLVGLGVGNGSANVEVLIPFSEKVALPALAGGAAASLTITSTACSSVSFDKVSKNSARMIATKASGTLGGGSVALIETNSPYNIIVDTGY